MAIKISGDEVISDTQQLELDGNSNIHKVQGKLTLTGNHDVDVQDTSGTLIIGNTGSYTLAFDHNEIQSRYNGTAMSMDFNPHGGMVNFGGSISVDGNITISGDNSAELSLSNTTLALDVGGTRQDTQNLGDMFNYIEVTSIMDPDATDSNVNFPITETVNCPSGTVLIPSIIKHEHMFPLNFTEGEATHWCEAAGEGTSTLSCIAYAMPFIAGTPWENSFKTECACAAVCIG